MKLYFCSFLFQDVEQDIKKSKKPNTISGHKFPSDLIRGFVANGVDTTVVNISRVRRYPDYPKIIFRKKNFLFEGKAPGIHLGFINLFGLNYITQTISSYRCLKKVLKNRDKSEQNILMVFNTTFPHARAMLAIKKRYPDVILCTAIGDIHGNFGIKTLKRGLLGRMANRLDDKIDKLSQKFDCFVFVTEYMAEALNVTDKPHTVLECTYTVDDSQESTLEDKQDENYKTVFFAGSLLKQYGIEHLLIAFSMIKEHNYRLWLAGNGDAVPIIQEYCQKDSRIEYLGFLTPQQVKDYQQQATVLINARKAWEYEYVKYSFAGKTMECLASGKPYIAHKLPCDPPEYADYIQYVKDDSDEALRDKIVEVCSLPKEERERIGQKARTFILREKNPQAMTKRVIELWKKMEDIHE